MEGLIFWWLVPIWIIVFATYMIFRYWHYKRSSKKLSKHELPVAHTDRLIHLPEYQNALKQYKLFFISLFLLASTSMIFLILISSRPTNLLAVTPNQNNRDIMLCLDVSGSVLKVDTALTNRFSSIVNSFNGQRFGVTIFNSSSVLVIPLNDSYDLISTQLEIISVAFKEQSGNTFDGLTNGTLVGFENGTSLTSDGLASCVQNMGANPQRRSQSVILATDNKVEGQPIVEIEKSIKLAKERGIAVHVIDPGTDDRAQQQNQNELIQIANETSGSYQELSNPNAVNNIVKSISKQPSKNYIGIDQVTATDQPQLFLVIATITTAACIVFLWRLGL